MGVGGRGGDPDVWLGSSSSAYYQFLYSWRNTLLYKSCAMCISNVFPLSTRLLSFSWHQSVGPGVMSTYQILSKLFHYTWEISFES